MTNKTKIQPAGSGTFWAVLLIGAAACSSPAEPDVAPSVARLDAEDELVLAFGADVRVEGTVLRLTFSDVEYDSRCPVDVTCVWAGDLAVELGVTLGTGPTVPHTLHTNGEVGPTGVDVGSYRITLIAVTPDPRSTVQIDEETYTIRLRVEAI